MHKGTISQEQRSSQRSIPLRRSGLVLRTSVIVTVLISIGALSLFGNNTRQSAHALANSQEMTPVMGWSSWNAYFTNINTSVIEAAANAIVSSGMKAAGYQYVNIDAGWWSGTRDSSGNITVNASKWPGGMQALASYIHSKGLKAGIYTDAGQDGCEGTTQGSYGHYDQDMLQFEQWGFDYVKVDWCGGAESSSNTLGGGAKVQSCNACSGGKNIGYIGKGGTLQFNNVNVSSAGSHRLVISYIDGDTSTFGIGTYRTANISINGGSSFAVDFPATGDWNEVVTLNITVTLKAGNNMVTFSNGSAYTADIDKIDVV